MPMALRFLSHRAVIRGAKYSGSSAEMNSEAMTQRHWAGSNSQKWVMT